ncbi:type II secretion system F family protein, partial [bacterium]|nr:type II secretion system F family protein [bacterium]
MPQYNYVALKDGKYQIKGKMSAESTRQVRAKIRSMGMIPTKITEDRRAAEKAKAANKEPDRPTTVKSLSLQEQIDFTSIFQILISSGIPLVEALLFIENDSANPKLQAISRELKNKIMAGSTFSATIADYSHIFNKVYIGLTKAGEDSGELDKTMLRLLELLKKQDSIKGRVLGALMYPAFTVLLAMVIVTIMLVFVFPTFKEMFDTQGKEMPWITATLMTAGEFLKQYWISIPIIFASVIFGTKFLFSWEPSRRIIDEKVLKIPLFRELMSYSNFSNFVAVMNVAYDAGIPIVDCLYLAQLTLTNYTLLDAMTEAIRAVQGGSQLSGALKASGVCPKMLLFM